MTDFLFILSLVILLMSACYADRKRNERINREKDLKDRFDIDPASGDFKRRSNGEQYTKDDICTGNMDDDRKELSVPLKDYLDNNSCTEDDEYGWCVTDALKDTLYKDEERFVILVTITETALKKIKMFGEKQNISPLDIVNRLVADNIKVVGALHLDFDPYNERVMTGLYTPDEIYPKEKKRHLHIALTKKSIALLSLHWSCSGARVTRGEILDILIHKHLNDKKGENIC